MNDEKLHLCLFFFFTLSASLFFFCFAGLHAVFAVGFVSGSFFVLQFLKFELLSQR